MINAQRIIQHKEKTNANVTLIFIKYLLSGIKSKTAPHISTFPKNFKTFNFIAPYFAACHFVISMPFLNIIAETVQPES